MKRHATNLTLVVLTAAIVVALCALPQSQVDAQTVQKKPAVPDLTAAKAVIQILDIQAEVVERLDNPLLAGQLAISRIKDLAVKAKKVDQSVKMLIGIAKENPHAAVRRSALLAVSELRENSGDLAGAMEAMVLMADVQDEDEDDDDDEHDDDDDDDDDDDEHERRKR